MIVVENLHKRFGPRIVAKGVNLTVESGETHVIIGRSGEGKSVLLKHICALLAPDKGRVLVDGREVLMNSKPSLKFVRSKVAMVFQYAALFDSLSVRENVGFALDEQRKPLHETDKLVAELLREVNLPGTEHLFPSELSGGMRKRIGLARALASRPEIILYDEPTTGLDPVTTDIINELILQTKRNYGVTSVVVTHDMSSAYKVGDRISMLYEGEIIFTGTPHEIRTTDNPYVKQFITGSAEGPITEKDQGDVVRLARKARTEVVQIQAELEGRPAPPPPPPSSEVAPPVYPESMYAQTEVGDSPRAETGAAAASARPATPASASPVSSPTAPASVPPHSLAGAAAPADPADLAQDAASTAPPVSAATTPTATSPGRTQTSPATSKPSTPAAPNGSK